MPIQQFGTIVAITTICSLLAAMRVQPSCLRLWAGWRGRKGDVEPLDVDHWVFEPVWASSRQAVT